MLEPSFLILVGALIGFCFGCLLFVLYLRLVSGRRKKDFRKEMNRIINQAKSRASRIERTAQAQARDLERKMRNKVEIETRKDRKKAEDLKYQAERQKNQLEAEWKQKIEDLEDQIKELDHQKSQNSKIEQQLKKEIQKTGEKMKELNHTMENVAGMNQKQAQEEIKKNLEADMKKELAGQLMTLEKELKEESEKKAQRILSQTLARFAAEVSTEKTTASLPIKGDETKGKIIGREGRNIRALEANCGVDIIIEESQEIILISCFDAVRREVAVKSIEQLLEEGRVHPARIEEVVGKIKRDIFISMAEEGKKTCFDLGVHNVHPTIIETLGSLKYRCVWENNALQSSIEVAHLAGLVASELGFNHKIAKRAGLFHTIGLGVDHRLEGSIASAGADFLKKHGESPSICQAVRCHNGRVTAESILDHILQSVYNLFLERPGAQRKVVANYVNRLQDLESIANSFDGVIRSFAIQTGKEIRVLVDSGKVTDEQAFMLSRDIAEKLHTEKGTAGHLIVSVVRECRMVEQAS